MENDCTLRCWEGNGVQLCQSTRHGNDVTPGIVGIGVGGIAVPGCHRCRLRCLSREQRMWQCAHAVIGILIPLPAAGHGCHLHGGLGAVNIPVGILPGDRAAGNGSQPPQTVIAHGQGSAHTGGSGIQAAVGRIVSIPLGIGGAACFRFGPMS